MQLKYIIGVDEAGRGPLAGPVAVGAVAIPERFNEWPLKRGLRDSKKLSEKKREEVFAWMKSQKNIKMSVALVSQEVIDKEGIVQAIKKGIAGTLTKLLANVPGEFWNIREVEVLLDGGLRAPDEFVNQKTIVRGDEKELAIALASIAAKVTRDRHMCRIADKYPEYGLEKHKGYGTKAHIEAIKKHGLTKIHRKSFCTNFAKSINY